MFCALWYSYFCHVISRSLKKESAERISTFEFLHAIGQLRFRGTSVLLRNRPSLKPFLGKLPYQSHMHALRERYEIKTSFMLHQIFEIEILQRKTVLNMKAARLKGDWAPPFIGCISTNLSNA